LCVKNCPAQALNEAGKTDVPKCVANSQPFGMRTNIVFWKKFAAGSPEEQKEMVGSEEFRRISQAHSIGMQYYCFQCMQICPVGKGKT
jgi:epoxyqueuosine reductase QueG